ncbi:maleylpyruvate isomerase N-terminal domain-containing protein [Nocardioides alcanivorans]|uniref:maleylpyruvate isomerase N-terminal domain-containing protein n=1 Tax=Nocardioides alcanivorans TaxID=2897352 RepID=UPI001F216CD1|nr:maleylpyruvate isomerase N-terminal domain-containing protein [Nocardioides alcanivorans]
MTRLETARYLDHLFHESARFRAVLTDADPEARVPSCPEWNAADLLRHLTEVQYFWARTINHRPDSPTRRSAGAIRRARRSGRRS